MKRSDMELLIQEVIRENYVLSSKEPILLNISQLSELIADKIEDVLVELDASTSDWNEE